MVVLKKRRKKKEEEKRTDTASLGISYARCARNYDSVDKTFPVHALLPLFSLNSAFFF